MEGTKAVSKSVSLPQNLWDLVEAHAPSTPGRDRSGYIRNLVEEDLKNNGPLAHDENAKAELLAAADEVGMQAALAALRAAKRTKKRAA